MHVCMMYVSMMHTSLILDYDECLYDAPMYDAYIYEYDPRSLTLMSASMTQQICHQRTNKAILGVGYICSMAWVEKGTYLVIFF